MSIKNRLKAAWEAFRRPDGFLLEQKYEIVHAFDWNGEAFYMHKEPLNTAAGRGLTAMVYMEELIMRCDVAYLREYCAAVRTIFSDPRKIDILKLATITGHLEERVNFLAAVPDHVFKLASVVFFTGNESPFKYDMKAGAARVAEWKNAPGAYDFFLQTPLVDLVPFLALPEQNSRAYLAVQEKISEIHFKGLRSAISDAVWSEGLKN